MALGMFGGAIARVEEHRCWRIGAAEGLVVAHGDSRRNDAAND
jgi:hypothetical protein